MLFMQQVITIGTPDEMMGAEPASSAMVFPYVKSVRLETGRFQPIDVLTAVLPRYAKQKVEAIKKGMILRWQAGYLQDGKPLGDGLVDEFEGIITEVDYRSHYDGSDPEKILKRSHSRNASFSLTIVAKDYMYACQQTLLDGLEWRGSMESEVTKILSSQGLMSKYGLRFVTDTSNKAEYSLRYNKENVNRSTVERGRGIHIVKLEDDNKVIVGHNRTVMWALMLLHRRWNSEYDLGLDVYFRGKRLILRDPNDTDWNERQPMWCFMSGANVIDDDLVARPGKKLRVVVRCYDAKKGEFFSGCFPKTKVHEEKAWNGLGDAPPTERTFDVDGLENAGKADYKAEQIFAEIAGDGFSGSFTIFGYPSLWHSELIGFADRENIDRPDRNKIVIIDKIIKTYDAERAQYRQQVFPGFVPTKIINPLTVVKRSPSQDGKPSVEVKSTPISSASGQGAVDRFGSFIREALGRR